MNAASQLSSDVARNLVIGAHMRCGLVAMIVCVGLAVAPLASAEDDETDVPATPPVLNDQQLLRKYVLSTLGPPGAIGATLGSSIDQWRGQPPEWGSGVPDSQSDGRRGMRRLRSETRRSMRSRG